MAEAMDTDEGTQQVPVNTHLTAIPVYEEVIIPPAPEAVQSFDGTGPRLMITKIVNENFKSYANTQTLGPFHKSFSSIVGPNGSGKSNVIDSMLFVFGYRASKIRSKKISVLIHSSSENPNCQSCTVAVHFQKIVDTGEGDDDYEVVPNSNFVVSRTAFSDNSSFYCVDGKRATYKEVADLLRKSGIDLDHNRFLILQGEVEQIALMKPKAPSEHEDGMLEFLEDIIGSSRFVSPIAQVTARVEQLSDFRREKLNRVKTVEKEKNDLEEVKNEAVEYLTSQNEITILQNKLYQKYLHEFEVTAEKVKVKHKEVAESMKEMTEKVDAIKARKKEKEKECRKMTKKFEELQAAFEENKEKFAELDRQDVRLREDIKHGRAKAKKLDKTLEQEQKKLEELEMIPTKTEKDVEELRTKLEKAEKDKEKEDAKLKEVMDSLKTETQGLQAEKEEKQEELMGLQKVANEARSTYSVADSEHQLYLSNLQSEEKRLKETERNLSNAAATIKDRKTGVADMEKRLPELEGALKKATADLTRAKEQEDQLSQRVKSGRQRVEEARSSLQAHTSRGKVIDALMALKRSGKIPGIYGRLGDLGGIDERFDVAVSTACGALDHIVVDTIGTGQKCVQFLKKNNVGVATFIGLDKMQRWREHCNGKIQTPENVPRLFDMIRVEDKEISPAFYFALRDTLVARDLDQATRIAYGKTRHRVVTVDGQLIETSGTMSGGGGRPSRGRMGTSVAVVDVDPAELESWENQLQKDNAEWDACRQTQTRLEDTVHQLQRQVNELKHAMQKFRVEIDSLTEQQKSLQQQVKEQEKRVRDAAPDEKQLKQLEKTVAAHKAEFDKAKAAADAVEEQVHSLHKQIMDIGGTKMKSAESRVNLVQTQIDTINGHITKANVAVKTALRNAKKCAVKVTSVQEEIAETKAAITKLEAEYKEVEGSGAAVFEAYNKAQADMKEVQGVVAGFQEELGEFEKEEQALSKDQIGVRHELEKHENLLKETAQKSKHWQKDLGKLSLHKVDQEEPAALEKYEAETLAEVSKDDTQYQITVLEEKLQQMKPNMAAIAEYRKKESIYLERVEELEKITRLRDEQHAKVEDFRKQRLQEFMAGFSLITNKLKEMYQMITLGGDAELELVDSLDPFSEGIVFSVRPPKKSWKSISNLSGGEKTLSSLALVFALHHYKPTPLYVMDEIDAALDFKNVSIVANYIRERTKNAQFIIISLRDNMFEHADRLIGIYKTYNCTKSVTINPKKLRLPLGPAQDNEANVNPAPVATAAESTQGL